MTPLYIIIKIAARDLALHYFNRLILLLKHFKAGGVQRLHNFTSAAEDKMFSSQKLNVLSGYKENQTNHDSSRKNCFEEAQIEIFGFKEKKGKVLLTWIGYFFSLGLLRLLHHWYPRVKLYSTHSSCSLEDAEKVLIADVYKEKYKTYSVKEVKNLSTNLRSVLCFNFYLL